MPLIIPYWSRIETMKRSSGDEADALRQPDPQSGGGRLRRPHEVSEIVWPYCLLISMWRDFNTGRHL